MWLYWLVQVILHIHQYTPHNDRTLALALLGSTFLAPKTPPSKSVSSCGPRNRKSLPRINFSHDHFWFYSSIQTVQWLQSDADSTLDIGVGRFCSVTQSTSTADRPRSAPFPLKQSISTISRQSWQRFPIGTVRGSLRVWQSAHTRPGLEVKASIVTHCSGPWLIANLK